MGPVSVPCCSNPLPLLSCRPTPKSLLPPCRRWGEAMFLDYLKMHGALMAQRHPIHNHQYDIIYSKAEDNDEDGEDEEDEEDEEEEEEEPVPPPKRLRKAPRHFQDYERLVD